MRAFAAALLVFLAPAAWAETPDLSTIVSDHILPRYQTLAETSAALAEAAQGKCDTNTPALKQAYHSAFDAWISVSHLRFGPSEVQERAFALAFWPDPRGSTPKSLAGLVRNLDDAVHDPQAFTTVSVAARGFYALEFLLFDTQFTQHAETTYICDLRRAVTRDIASNTAAILADWQGGYAALMAQPGNDIYRTPSEAAQQLFTAALTGLEFTAQQRLARPMGSFDRPRPNRAEARRSERSLRHVVLSLRATQDLALRLAPDTDAVTRAFDRAITRAETLDDPVFAGVATSQGRLRVEALQQSVDGIRTLLTQEVGPSLGIAAGFNALDGD
ncbi:MAG: imelysin family protein [Rhodobacteraceae bacterium]|nr:imelysin family protein [Paracoccaceae bacterium]